MKQSAMRDDRARAARISLTLHPGYLDHHGYEAHCVFALVRASAISLRIGSASSVSAAAAA
jgi:hypothetical protein